ncbi:MAG: hypothetical protein U0166_24940 [Acidobacteriota bacterium]
MRRSLVALAAALLISGPVLADEPPDEQAVVEVLKLMREMASLDPSDTTGIVKIQNRVNRVLQEATDLDPSKDPAAYKARTEPIRAEAARRFKAELEDKPVMSDMPRLATTRTRLRTIFVALHAYYAEYGKLPPDIGPIIAAGGLEEETLEDGWHHSILYRPAPGGELRFELVAPGQDGKPDTPDDETLSAP